MTGARAYSVQLEHTEKVLERELRRESYKPPPENRFERLRQKGEKILHSKHVLLVVVVLNLVDCGLVLGELILDVHYVKEIRKETVGEIQTFIDQMQTRFPELAHGYTVDNIDNLYSRIYQTNVTSLCEENRRNIELHNKANGSLELHPLELKDKGIIGRIEDKHVQLVGDVNRNSTGRVSNEENSTANHHKEHKLTEDIAHGMHKASITILGILFVENIVKIICMGRHSFQRKLEVFDAVVVVVSFVVDLVYIKGITEIPVQDGLFILSFLLPWRVIRVVNSLIVAVLDQEHLRLKMIYKEKKSIEAKLMVLRTMEKKWDFHLQKIESFCESEGIPKWKIRQHTAMGRKKSTITSMASLALNGVLDWVCFNQADRNIFMKSFERSISTNTDENNTCIDTTTTVIKHAHDTVLNIDTTVEDDNNISKTSNDNASRNESLQLNLQQNQEQSYQYQHKVSPNDTNTIMGAINEGFDTVDHESDSRLGNVKHDDSQSWCCDTTNVSGTGHGKERDKPLVKQVSFESSQTKSALARENSIHDEHTDTKTASIENEIKED